MMNQNDKVSEIFDEYENIYGTTVNAAIGVPGLNVDYFTKVKADYILELTINKFGQTKNVDVLDIGCGIGNFHGLLNGHFHSLSGVDVSKESIKKAKQSNPSVKYEHYDGARLPYSDNSFDLAFTVCVMHHVPPESWSHFANEMFRIVRPGGMALVFEHNPQNPLTRRIVDRCPFDEDAVLLKSGKTVELLGSAGFETLTARFILSVPAGNGLLRGVDRLFSRLPFGAQYYVRADKAGARLA